MKYLKGEAKEACREQVRGVWAALTLPFTQEGAIDEEGLRRNVSTIFDDLRVSGVFCGGAMGEFWALTMEERKRTHEIVIDTARGRGGVIVHTGHHCIADARELTIHAQEAGADFVAAFTPYYPNIVEQGIPAYFNALLAGMDIGLWLIDTGLAGPYLSIDMTVELTKIPNVCGIKIIRDDAYMEELSRRTGGSILLSSPVEKRWLELLRKGHQAFMSDASPFLLQSPGHTPMADYTDAAVRGDWDEAEAIAASMEDLRALYHDWVARDAQRGLPPTPWIKAWSARQGLAAGPLRAPAVFPDDEAQMLHRQLDQLLPAAAR